MVNCILCDESFGPGRKRTREHVFPEWLEKLFVSDDDEGRVPYSQWTRARGQPMSEKEWRDVPFNIVIREVCEPCNTKWGSKIEDEAKPILMPLIAGSPRALDASEQTSLAVWATKTLLMLQMTHPRQVSIPRVWFHWFREHRWPLPSEQIWIAHYDGEGPWPVSYRQYGISLRDTAVDDLPEDAHSHASAISVGHLVFVLFGHMIEGGPRATPQEGTKSVKALRDIWPAMGNAVRFPPPATILGDAELTAVLDAFGDAEEFRRS